MSDSCCKEHRPLLCEETDEESHQFVPNQRRHMGQRSRVKNNIKGAAAIIKNWPDHWSSSVTYWWIGLGMLALTTFIIYNSVLSYALLNTVDSKPTSRQPTVDMMDPFQKRYLPDIFMHVFVNNDKEANLDKLLPYVEIIANDYLHYKFNLVVLFNDTKQDKQNCQAEINNDDALNSLWTVNAIHELDLTPSKKKTNVDIQYNNLSTYLNSSPLRKYWKRLPHQFIEFLVRAVSIWDKGGVVFNPIILTPKSPHATYIEKLQNILLNFQETSKLTVAKHIEQNAQKSEHKKNRNGHHVAPNHEHRNKKKVNNIRDIIDALETDTGLESQSLSEAENRQDDTKIEIKASLSELNALSDGANLTTGYQNHLENSKLSKSTAVDTDNNLSQMNETSHLLPSFIDFLFREGSKIALQQRDSRNFTNKGHVTKRSSTTVPNESHKKGEENDKIIQPMIIPAPTVFDKFAAEEVENNVPTQYEGEDKLTIDLKGNLMATKIPCHAFLGSVFSNVKHYTEEESLKDFIISELSQFCKGLLSTCKGVEVILL
ncbi:uncharacterized protein isoform X2 [Choristoneura fumiferana]